MSLKSVIQRAKLKFRCFFFLQSLLFRWAVFCCSYTVRKRKENKWRFDLISKLKLINRFFRRLFCLSWNIPEIYSSCVRCCSYITRFFTFQIIKSVNSDDNGDVGCWRWKSNFIMRLTEGKKRHINGNIKKKTDDQSFWLFY